MLAPISTGHRGKGRIPAPLLRVAAGAGGVNPRRAWRGRAVLRRAAGSARPARKLPCKQRFDTATPGAAAARATRRKEACATVHP